MPSLNLLLGVVLVVVLANIFSRIIGLSATAAGIFLLELAHGVLRLDELWKH